MYIVRINIQNIDIDASKRQKEGTYKGRTVALIELNVMLAFCKTKQ